LEGLAAQCGVATLKVVTCFDLFLKNYKGAKHSYIVFAVGGKIGTETWVNCGCLFYKKGF
jgi:hypothetical protein